MSHKKHGLPPTYVPPIGAGGINQFDPETEEDRDHMLDEFYRQRDKELDQQREAASVRPYNAPPPPTRIGFSTLEVLIAMLLVGVLVVTFDSMLYKRHLLDDARVDGARVRQDIETDNQLARTQGPALTSIPPAPVVIDPLSSADLSTIDKTIQQAFDRNDPCRAVPVFGK